MALTLPSSMALRAGAQGEEDKKPSVALRASPSVAFAPARIFVSAEIRGGADDYQEFYCPTIEWDWGDGTRSEARSDCDPYEPGKTEIRRRYSITHTYRQAGMFRIYLRLKQGSEVVGLGNTTVQIRPGLPR